MAQVNNKTAKKMRTNINMWGKIRWRNASASLIYVCTFGRNGYCVFGSF